MNIIDELIQSYTYNGEVSTKALDDDIATLENQIESYNATLKEIRLRKKNDGPLVDRIREAQIRLSVLNVVRNKVMKDKTEDDVAMEILTDTEIPKPEVKIDTESGMVEIVKLENTGPDYFIPEPEEKKDVIVANEPEIPQYTFIDEKTMDPVQFDSDVNEFENTSASSVSYDGTPWVEEDETVPGYEMTDEVEPFYEEFGGSDRVDFIKASVDLSELTDMVNTGYIKPTIDFIKKTIKLRITDVRDYLVFLELVRLKNENRWWKNLFTKKIQKNVFITVTTDEYGTLFDTEWNFTFHNCRVVEVEDSELPSYFYPEPGHWCCVTLKYDKLTTLYGTTRKKKNNCETENQPEEADEITEKGTS